MPFENVVASVLSSTIIAAVIGKGEQHAYGFREGDVRVNAFVYAYMRSFAKLIDV